MADLNALIAQGAQFNMPNPVDQYSKVMQLQQMGQANQLNRLKMDEYTRGVAEQNAMRGVMAQPGFDVNNPEHQAALLQAAPGTAPTLLEKLAQVKKEQAQTGLYGAQAGELNFKVKQQQLTQGLTEISNMSNEADALASLDTHVADGSISAEKAAGLKKQIMAMGFPNWQTQTITGMTDAKNRLDALEEQRYQAFKKQPVVGAPVAPAAAAAPPEMFITKDSSGRPRYVVNGVEVSPQDYQSAQSGVVAGAAPAAKPVGYELPIAEPTNALAPAAQPDMANALAMKIQGLQTERDSLEPFLKSASAKLKYENLGKQIENLSKGFSVSAGGAYFQPGVGMVARDAAAPALSDVSRFIAERNAAVARNAPPDEIAALNAAIKKATTPAQGTTVNVNAGSKAEEVEFGKYVVDQYKDISARADVATRSLPALDINLKTLEKGFDTGFGAETIAAGAKVLAALGVQNAKDFATDAQTFLANANSAVLQKQLEQKGVQTAADADRITSTGAQLGNTKEANKFILSVAKAQLQRDVAQRKFYSDWREENKTFRGAEDAWYAGQGSASLFDSPILKKYAEPVAGQAENRKVGLDKIFKKAP